MVRSVTLFAFLSVVALTQAASVQERLSRLEDEVSAVKRHVFLGQQAQTSAAFSVRLDEDVTITDATVLFDRVDLNVGGGFDASTGMGICIPITHLVFESFLSPSNVLLAIVAKQV